MKITRKLLGACIIGNALEIYDFVLFGIFSLIISKNFFPESEPLIALISTLGVFSAGFLMRPLGGILFGHLGDRLGRKRALTASMLLMTVSTFCMGVLPTYAQIGMVAPLLLILCRLFQGLSSGGEYTGATIFVLENHTYNIRGYVGAIVNSSSGIGSILATLTGLLVLQESSPSWAWRVPFLLGSVIGFAAYYMRIKFNESPEFLKIRKRQILKIPLKSVFLEKAESICCASGIAACGCSYVYIQLVYMNIYLNKFGEFSVTQSISFTSIGLVTCFLFTLVSGAWSDKVGKQNVMRLFTVLGFVTAYPNFLLLQTGSESFAVISQILFGFIAGGFLGPMNALLVDLFPVNIRYSALGLSFSLGQSIMGTTPLVATLLTELTHNPLSPAFFVMFCSFIGFASLYFSGRQEQFVDIFKGARITGADDAHPQVL